MKENFYIGTYSNNIVICELNNGKLQIINKIEGIEKPSYLHKNGNILYAVSETKIGGIATFEIKDRELLTPLDFRIINQSLPCYVTTNKKRNCLLVANYTSGSVNMYHIHPNGQIDRLLYYKSYENAHMHFADFVGNYIYAIDLGNNCIYVYNLKMELQSTIQMDDNIGPRHLAISKDEKIIYIITENSNQIFIYSKKNNVFTLEQKVKTLINKNIISYAGAIKINSSNHNIYVTNRGDNTISVFEVNKTRLKLVQNISSYGKFPRDICLSQKEDYALIANQKSNNVVMYKINKVDGKILQKVQTIEIDQPACIINNIF